VPEGDKMSSFVTDLSGNISMAAKNLEASASTRAHKKCRRKIFESNVSFKKSFSDLKHFF